MRDRKLMTSVLIASAAAALFDAFYLIYAIYRFIAYFANAKFVSAGFSALSVTAIIINSICALVIISLLLIRHLSHKKAQRRKN